MSTSYSLFTIYATAGQPVDLSPFFDAAGIANSSYDNISWQLAIQDEGEMIWSGLVLENGTLEQGSAPPDFVYIATPTCNALLEIQIIFLPDPDKPCPNGNCGDSDTDQTGCQSCSASPDSGDSVELATGKFIFQKELLSLLGLGSQSWRFDLNYKSNLDIDGLLGPGFSYPQYTHLEQLTGGYVFDNDIQLVTDNLSRTVFLADSEYAPNAGNNSRMLLWVINQYETNEEFILNASNGTITRFHGFDYFHPYGSTTNISNPAPGQIKSIVDRNGNTQLFNWTNTHSYVDEYGQTIYDGIPQLASVTDSYGRTITYSYFEGDEGGRLKQITDFLGRTLNFQYDAEGRLIAVITPSILKSAPGNTFFGGTAYAFQYDEGNADPARQGDLIRIWYPNQTQPFLDVDSRTLDVPSVYAEAAPRYIITYGQNINESNSYGKVLTETLGDPENGTGGTATFAYVTTDLPTNIIDDSEAGTIVNRTIYTDRNGNTTWYDFNANWTVSRLQVNLNRYKDSLELDNEDTGGMATPPFVTWTKFNAQNQPVVIVYPEGNSTEYTYDTGNIYLDYIFILRQGLMLSESRLPGNSIGIPSRSGSNGQTILTKRYFYEPIYNQICAVIEERGNPVDGTTYFTPQNGGTTPTNADRSRYTTIYTFDYQKDTLDTVKESTFLEYYLGLYPGQIVGLFNYVSAQMSATDGTGGIPSGFPMGLGDINGDGTGNGAGSGLPSASYLGNVIRVVHPSVLMVDGTTQPRVELFTVNLRGQITTATDSEGNLTITTRYPENDPEGTGQTSSSLSTQQYGLVREVHRDANPDDVMSLVGESGDLVAFVPNLITRTNTPGVYQDLVTRYEGSSGCMACAYDAMGNVLSETDPRGFTTITDRNEMGEVYRVTSPAPYNFRVETSYDANRNVIQVDTEDLQVLYNSTDPTSAGYGTFTPSGSGTTAQVPMTAGPGGAVRPGWFSNLMSFDILDDKIEEDIDATGSTPTSLVTRYAYDANQNLIKITKPLGNTVEYEYDERDLKIAQRIGFDAALSLPGAVTAYSYDGNKNLLNVIGPVDHNAGESPGATSLTAYIARAFGAGSSLTVTGDWVLQNTYDGFNRVIAATDAVGGVVTSTYDPTSTVIAKQASGIIGGATPTDHTGSTNATLANSVRRFDEARRLYEQQQDVFLASGVTLSSGRAVTHTGGGLATNSTANDHTGTVTLTTGGSSYVLTRMVYDRSGRLSITLTDNTAQTTNAYDGADREILVTDPLGNTVATQPDGNGNPVAVTRTDVCTITSPTVPHEVFNTFTWFDCLNRPVVAGSQGADGALTADLGLCCPWQGLPSTLFSLIGYDSRNNRVTVTDPKQNVVVSVFDGASRLIETQQEMRQNGDGRNAPTPNQTFLSAGGGVIRTEFLYDANSHLSELVDDRGATTVFGYDELDRQVTKMLADGSISTRVYDLASCLIGFTDENGSVFVMTFDALSRKKAAAITLATGVTGTTAQSFQYDGLSRNTQAIDTVGSTLAAVNSIYDSISRVLEESQGLGGTFRNTTHTAWTSWVATQVTYPTTDITLTNGYDLLYRRNAVTGASATGGTLDTVGWNFFGPQRVVETNYGSGSLIATQMNNARTHAAVQAGVALPGWGDISSDRLGYDGAGRMIAKRYLTGGISGGTFAYNSSTSLVGHTTSFDRASNKLYERHLEAESRSHLYQPVNTDGSLAVGYDSANRLRQYQRGVLSSATIPYRVPAGSSISTPTTLPGADQTRSYGLDGLGNWKTTDFTIEFSPTSEVHQHNYVNQISSVRDTTGGTSTTTAFAYDHGNNTDGVQGNGNLVKDGTRTYQWDAFNRLVQISNAAGSTVIASYVYDALNRRVQKTIADLSGGFGGLTGDIPAGTTDYLYDGQQIIEQRDNAAPDDWTQVSFWGQYVDELLFLAVPGPTVYRLLSDLLYRSVALVTTSNVVTEAYDCDAYGNTICYSGPGADSIWFTNDDATTNNPINTTIFTGRQYDPESEIYYYRARYYSPTIGRFISRDPLENAEFSQGPNLYWYVKNNPSKYVDPSGKDVGGSVTAALFVACPLAQCEGLCTACCGAAYSAGLGVIGIGFDEGSLICVGLAVVIPPPFDIAALAICEIAVVALAAAAAAQLTSDANGCLKECAKLPPCCSPAEPEQGNLSAIPLA